MRDGVSRGVYAGALAPRSFQIGFLRVTLLHPIGRLRLTSERTQSAKAHAERDDAAGANRRRVETGPGVWWGAAQVTDAILKKHPALAMPPLTELLNRPSDATLARKARREAEEAKQAEREAARVRMVDAQGRASALGRRKTASARVWLSEVEFGSFSTLRVNGRLWTEYFPNLEHRAKVRPRALPPYTAQKQN